MRRLVLLMTSALTEPHFGEVWDWQGMGPYMILCRSPIIGYVNVIVLTGEFDQGRLVSMVWDQPGKNFIDYWKRLDKGELV